MLRTAGVGHLGSSAALRSSGVLEPTPLPRSGKATGDCVAALPRQSRRSVTGGSDSGLLRPRPRTCRGVIGEPQFRMRGVTSQARQLPRPVTPLFKETGTPVRLLDRCARQPVLNTSVVAGEYRTHLYVMTQFPAIKLVFDFACHCDRHAATRWIKIADLEYAYSALLITANAADQITDAV